MGHTFPLYKLLPYFPWQREKLRAFGCVWVKAVAGSAKASHALRPCNAQGSEHTPLCFYPEFGIVGLTGALDSGCGYCFRSTQKPPGISLREEFLGLLCKYNMSLLSPEDCRPEPPSWLRAEQGGRMGGSSHQVKVGLLFKL